MVGPFPFEAPLQDNEKTEQHSVQARAKGTGAREDQRQGAAAGSLGRAAPPTWRTNHCMKPVSCSTCVSASPIMAGDRVSLRGQADQVEALVSGAGQVLASDNNRCRVK